MMLVTGGAGFIGSNLVDALLGKGYGVRVIDDLSTGKRENLNAASDSRGFGFAKGDIRKFSDKILKDVEVVFHQAAQVAVRKSIKEPLHDLDVNVSGTLNLLERMRKNDVGKIVYASSGGAVYGNPEYMPCDEKHPTNPVSPYGASKLAAEKYIRVYSENYGIDYVNLRYANVYGPRQDPSGEGGGIAIFLGRILRDEKLVIFGDGSQTRDYVHVHDVVGANLLAIGKRMGNETFNVGAGVETSVNQLVDMMRGLVDNDIIAEHGGDIKGEVRRICLDISKIKKSGFNPKYDLESGMRSVLEWMSNRR
mgnify:CR=1 FL=1